MPDVHSHEARRRNMAAIRAGNTKPELQVRRFLHAEGYRYRLHARQLPGRPDIVLPKHRVVIMVNGCFFHGHSCRYFRWPATRAEFWHAKIASNQSRDARNLASLSAAGWRVLTIWECAVRGDERSRQTALTDVLRWLRGSQETGSISGSSK